MLDTLFDKLKRASKALLVLLGAFLVLLLLYTQSTDLPIKFLVILVAIAALLIIFLPSNIEYATVLIIVVMGSVSAFISPINDIPDERVHFARALYLSEGNLNLTNDDSKLLVTDDINLMDHNNGKPLRFQLWSRDHTDEAISFKEIRSTNGYYNFAYIPQAIGLFIGRSLGLTMGLSYLLGRLCNVLAYAILVFVALRLLTAGKQLLAVGSLLPMNIYLAGSYNQDCVSIGLIILTISLFVQMATTEKIPLSKLFWYTLLCSIITFTKLPYILLIFLLLFIPSRQFGAKASRTFLLKLLSILTVLAVTVFWLKIYGQIKSPQVDMADFLQKVNAKEQLLTVLRHPIVYGFMLLRHTLAHILNPSGIYMFGPLSYGMVELMPISMVYYFAVVITNANKLQLPALSRFGMGLMSLGIIGGITFSLYLTFTPVGDLNVLGVQDRYFLGVIPLVLVLLASNNKYLEKAQGLLSNRQVLIGSLLLILGMITRTMLQYYT
ncbi:TPA: DUF2142 domain-containing protein [Streptococcus equi subsp. zooepidemicus]|nr:DUF2142 domain-containing protein [Streptococcus equi subsp. zooepidemicus]